MAHSFCEAILPWLVKMICTFSYVYDGPDYDQEQIGRHYLVASAGPRVRIDRIVSANDKMKTIIAETETECLFTVLALDTLSPEYYLIWRCCQRHHERLFSNVRCYVAWGIYKFLSKAWSQDNQFKLDRSMVMKMKAILVWKWKEWW